ncbi:MAG: RtcB family protein [Candidatus Aenigmatarchaeota archaeon]
MSWKSKVKKISDYEWEIEKGVKPNMNVPVRLFLSEKLLQEVEDGAIEQAINVATLPGIQRYSIAMPDMHFGYGFPVGGIAGIDYYNGCVSPGGIGFDIGCGVRVLRTNLTYEQIKDKLYDLVNEIFRSVPAGVGSEGLVKLSASQTYEVLKYGAKWAVENGYGTEKDLEFIEDNGCEEENANPEYVSQKAIERGMPQLGTLGSGNHFLEIQVVDRIFDREIAKVLGIEREGQIVVMIHTGSRGLGHQVASDYLEIIEREFRDLIRKLPDRQLAYAPSGTKVFERYLGAMFSAANYAFANRQMITHWIRESFVRVLKMPLEEIGLQIVYDIHHNMAKLEEHKVDGEKKKLLVHRKGATRAYPPYSPYIPKAYEKIGQPVLIPGSMGTASYILVGVETAEKTFYSSAHGSGRVASRAAMMRKYRYQDAVKLIESKGILIKSTTKEGVIEELPEAYKNVDEVVLTTERAGISKIVVRMRPIAVVKG